MQPQGNEETKAYQNPQMTQMGTNECPRNPDSSHLRQSVKSVDSPSDLSLFLRSFVVSSLQVAGVVQEFHDWTPVPVLNEVEAGV